MNSNPGIVVISNRIVLAVTLEPRPLHAWPIPSKVYVIDGREREVVDAENLEFVVRAAVKVAQTDRVVMDAGAMGFIPTQVWDAVDAAGVTVELLEESAVRASLAASMSQPMESRLEWALYQVPGFVCSELPTRACAIAESWTRTDRRRRMDAIAAVVRATA